jgi:hypothetical protein
MRIRIDLSTLGQTKWHDYAVRFFFGGLITAATGIIAKKLGLAIGGLFLAFPAIFPASATLIEKHERKKKQLLGLGGGSWQDRSQYRCNWLIHRKHRVACLCICRLAIYAARSRMDRSRSRHAFMARRLRGGLAYSKGIVGGDQMCCKNSPPPLSL